MSTNTETSVPPTSRDVGNVLIKALPRLERESFLSCCDIVELGAGELLVEVGDSLSSAYFPSSGTISLSAQVHDHPSLEIALLGRTAMFGAALAFGGRVSEVKAAVCSEGWAWRIGARPFRAALVRSTPLRTLVQGSMRHLNVQLAHAVPCICFHSLQERLALWLLQTQDLTGASVLPFTHLQLANTLGVQRSAVTLAAGRLQQQGFIHYARGDVCISNREGLERAACECYAQGWRA